MRSHSLSYPFIIEHHHKILALDGHGLIVLNYVWKTLQGDGWIILQLYLLMFQSSDDEPREEKDHFVAQLYKFMDDRGTPLNRNPTIANRDIDLYRLFRVRFDALIYTARCY